MRDDRDTPVHIEIGFKEFTKGQSTWKSMPANMIRKTAIVNALREAFPNDLGAMYTEEDKNDSSEHTNIRTVNEASSQAPKSINELNEDKKEGKVEPKQSVKNVTPKDTKDPMSDEEARKVYDEIKNGGTDEDAGTTEDSEQSDDSQQQELL